MAYNHGREERKWRIWKEAEERILRKCGVDDDAIEKIRIYDRADFLDEIENENLSIKKKKKRHSYEDYTVI